MQVVEYEPNNRGEIQASCTGIGGRPTPTFHWFVDDSNNKEIDEDELNANDREWDDNGVPMIEQSIRYARKAGQRGALIDCQISLPENGSVAP